MTAGSAGAIGFDCRLMAMEITGSETFLHLNFGQDRWVGLVDGVRQFETGTNLRLWLDSAHIYIFDGAGRLAAPAAYAMAA